MNRSKNTAEYANETYKLTEINYGSKAEKVRINKIISLVGSDHRILDIGCYDGTIGNLLKKMSNDVYGIEVSESVANLAKKKGVKVIVQDIESKFNFDDKFFDIVVAGEIIEHILDVDLFIDNIKRVMMPDGHLILSTPNVASLGRRLLLLFGKNPYFEASFGFPKNSHAGHIRFYTKDLLLDFLKYKGFDIINFESDIINFLPSGKIANKLLADLIPTFGRSLIVKAQLNPECNRY